VSVISLLRLELPCLLDEKKTVSWSNSMFCGQFHSCWPFCPTCPQIPCMYYTRFDSLARFVGEISFNRGSVRMYTSRLSFQRTALRVVHENFVAQSLNSSSFRVLLKFQLWHVAFVCLNTRSYHTCNPESHKACKFWCGFWYVTNPPLSCMCQSANKK
jgi:hypothetical protein